MLTKKETLKKLYGLLSDYKLKLTISMILLVISTVCIVYAPKLAGQTIDLFLDPINDERKHLIFVNIVKLFLLYIAGYSIRLPSSRMVIFVGEQVTYKLRIALHDKLTNGQLKMFNRENSGNLMGRLNNDLMNIRELITIHISTYLSDFLTIGLTLILILTTNWQLGLVFLCIMPILILCFYISDATSKNHYDQHQKTLGEMIGLMGDSLTNHLLIQAYNSEDYIEEKFDDINKEVTFNFNKSRFHTGIHPPSVQLIINMSKIMIYILGVILLISHEIEIGTLLTVILYSQILVKPIKNISNGLNILETSVASIDRIYQILDSEPELTTGDKHLKDSEGNIEFRNVGNVNLNVDAGEVVAITGSDSLSKSKLMEQLLRLYKVESGMILLDGIDIYDIDIDDYRKQFGYVPHYRWIFEGTIAENIGYGLEEYSMEGIENVCKTIGYDEIIQNLPKKYDTVVSDEKNTVSASEKELICIARALIKNPKILILDSVNADISYLFEDRTVFIISDDETVIRNCDKVIQIE